MNGSMGPREGRHAGDDGKGRDISRPLWTKANRERCHILTTNYWNVRLDTCLDVYTSGIEKGEIRRKMFD